MINYFTRFRNRARIQAALLRRREDNPIGVSLDARVSLEDSGAVFLNARSGVVFTSNRVGSRIWQGLLDRESLETIAMRISREAGVQIDQVRQDTAEFVTELEVQGFLFRRAGC
jgi:hypothetical protein